jgi:hypothetical protein
MIAKPILCLLLFLSIHTLVLCKDVYINSTAVLPCTDPSLCYFLEPSLWNNSIPPETNDNVYITDLPTFAYMTFNDSLSLSQLFIEGNLTLYVIGNSQLTSQNISLSGSTLIISGASKVVSTQNTWLVDSSQLLVNQATGGFQQLGGEVFYLSKSSVLELQTGYLNLSSDESRIHGVVMTMGTAKFAATGQLHFDNNTQAEFADYPSFDTVNFWFTSVTFLQGFQANSINLMTSNVTVYGSNGLYQNYSNIFVDTGSVFFIRKLSECYLDVTKVAGLLFISTSIVTFSGDQKFPIVFGGSSSLYGRSLNLVSVRHTTGDNGEAAYVNIFADSLTTSGIVELPVGAVQINNYAFFAGTFSTAGAIFASGRVFVQGTFFAYQQIKLEGTPVGSVLRNTWEVDAGSVLSTYNFTIGHDSVLRTYSANIICSYMYMLPNSSLHHHESTYIGDLINDGKLSIRHDLNWTGNYTQLPDGVLDFEDINLPNRTNGQFIVLGKAFLEGTITYNVTTDLHKSGKVQLVVLNATGGVSGKFKTSPVNVGATHASKISMDYSSNTVRLVFEKKAAKKNLWYVWFLLVLGFGIAIGVFGYYKYRQSRSGYSMVGN